MKKVYLIFVLMGVILYSPSTLASDIVNIGIKSNLSQHILSNCRFGSALALSTDTGHVVVTIPSNTKNAKIVGLRQNSAALPDSYRASKLEFDDQSMMKLFGWNVKYSSENSSNYPAILFKDWIVMEYSGNYLKSYGYKVGMTLFSALPAGINAASIYNKGEVNLAYRMAAQGQLECDIYNSITGKAIGLVDYVTDSGSGSYKTLAYGAGEEWAANSQNLNLFSMEVKRSEYHGSYPNKRILLTMSDRSVAQSPGTQVEVAVAGTTLPQRPVSAMPANVVSSQYQAKVSNKTDNYTFKSCTTKDTHGSWIDKPTDNEVVKPGGYFTFGMKSKGHGIQGEVSCAIFYQTGTDPEIEMGRLLVEIDNDGTAFAVFPFINDANVSARLVAAKFKYTLYVENDKDSNFSITVRQ